LDSLVYHGRGGFCAPGCRFSVSRIAASAPIGSPNANPCAYSRDPLARNDVDRLRCTGYHGAQLAAQTPSTITGARRSVSAQNIDCYEMRSERLLLESFSRRGPIVAPIWDDLGIPRA
jgi:hypothetical protein